MLDRPTRPCESSSPLGRRVFHFAPAAFAATILLAPLVWTILESLLASAPPTQAPAIDGRALAMSIAVAAAATAMALLVGALLAAAVTLVDLGHSALWATALVAPFLAPSMVWAMGQVYCFGAGGLVERWLGEPWRWARAASDSGNHFATALVLAEIHAPLAMLLLGRGMSRLGASGFDAARLALPPCALARWIAGAIRPEAAAAAALVFAMALGNLAVPHVLQCRLYPIEIYARVSNYLDPLGAFRAALPLVAVALAGSAVLARTQRRGAASALPSAPPAVLRLGQRRWIVIAILGAYLSVTTVLPLAALTAECRSPSLFLQTVREASEETGNSLVLAFATSAVALAAGAAVGAWASRARSTLLLTATLLPLALPPLVVAIGYARFYHHDWPVDLEVLTRSGALVTLGLALRAWPFVTRSVAAGYTRIAPEWEEAARLAGFSPWRRWRTITVPLLADHAIAGAVVALVLALGDVEISQMLCAPGSGTLALRLFSYLHFGPVHVGASLAVLQMLLAWTPLAVYFLATNRCLQVL